MKMQKMQGRLCLAYSAAMVLNVPVRYILEEINKNIHGADLETRGIHMQEILPSFVSRGMSLMPIQPMPRLGVDGSHNITIDNSKYFENIIRGKCGIIIGDYQGKPHAVAWDGKICYDPNGFYLPLDVYDIEEMWILTMMIT